MSEYYFFEKILIINEIIMLIIIEEIIGKWNEKFSFRMLMSPISNRKKNPRLLSGDF